jgi:hypothetical protein
MRRRLVSRDYSEGGCSRLVPTLCRLYSRSKRILAKSSRCSGERLRRSARSASSTPLESSLATISYRSSERSSLLPTLGRPAEVIIVS